MIQYIYILLKYLHWRYTFPQQFRSVKFCRNSLIGTVVTPIPLGNGRNLQYLYRHFAATSFLVRLHCMYYLYLFIVKLYRMYYLYYIVTHNRFVFVCSHSTIFSYVLFILSCTMCYFRFVCTLFILFCFSDTNTPRPCITDTIGASYHFPYLTAPKESMVALLFRQVHCENFLVLT